MASSRRGSVLRGKQRKKLSAESEGRWELNQTQGLCNRASPCQGRTILRVSWGHFCLSPISSPARLIAGLTVFA